MNAVGMTAGAALLLAAALVADEPIVFPHRLETWAAIAYLVVIGSVVVFLLYLVVLRYWAASRASYGFVIIPFVTLCSLPGSTTSRSASDWWSEASWSWPASMSVRSAPPESLQRLRMRRLTWADPQAPR